MRRYIQQRDDDDYSCGPIAILNAAKWAGKSLTLKKDFQRIKCLTKCNKSGSLPFNIDIALQKELKGFAYIEWKNVYLPKSLFERVKNLNIRDIRKEFEKGNSIIISFGYLEKRKIHGHIMFVSEYDNGHFLAHSYEKGSACTWIPKREMSKLLHFVAVEDDGTEYPDVWIIRRKGDHGVSTKNY